jgi:hypothetical protein
MWAQEFYWESCFGQSHPRGSLGQCASPQLLEKAGSGSGLLLAKHRLASFPGIPSIHLHSAFFLAHPLAGSSQAIQVARLCTASELLHSPHRPSAPCNATRPRSADSGNRSPIVTCSVAWEIYRRRHITLQGAISSSALVCLFVKLSVGLLAIITNLEGRKEGK